jgi:predicted Zn finger-like uncharacterized protein
MKIVCESCQAKYSIADEKVSGKVFKIRCKRCGEVIVVRGDQEPQGEEATRVYDYAQDAVWHAVINGDQQGPFAPQQLGEMLTAGTLDWDAYVWCEGFDNWLPMRDVPDLVAAITGQGAPSGGGGGGFAAAAAPAVAARQPAVDYGAQPSMGADPFADDGGGGGGGLFDEPAPAAAAPDLFGGGGGGSPFDSGRGRVVSSSPSPRVSAEQAMTGARNENSVLFSLKNLQALATGSSSGAGAASPAAVDFGGGGSSDRPGFAAGEGSGLIDIRALATATGVGSSDSSEEKDELLSIGSQTGAFGSLGSPMLAPVAQEDGGGKKMIVWAGVAGVAFLSAAAVAVAFILRPAPQAASEPVQPAAAVAAVAAPAAAPAAAPSAEDAPSEGELAAKAAAAKDEKEESGSREGSSGKRRPKAAGGGDAPSEAAGDAPAREPTKEPAAETKKPSGSAGSSIDDLLKGALEGGSSAKKPKPPAPAADDNLQPKPTRDQVLEAMNGVKGEVQACAQGATGVAFAEVTVSGATGRVTNAQISGQTGAIGSCIARVVRKAKFPKFKEATFQVKFPYRLQ